MLEFETDVPRPPQSEGEILEWARNFSAWLKAQEGIGEETFEETLALGGLVANRMFGFEGTFSGTTAPTDHVLLTGPAELGKKRIVVAVNVTTNSSGGRGSLQVRKSGATTRLNIMEFLSAADNTGSDQDDRTMDYRGFITLDDDDESLEFHIDAVLDAGNFHFQGSYLEVD